MRHYKLRYKSFPEELRGEVYGATLQANGKLTVLIDKSMSATEQKKALMHELAHISLGHFEASEQRPATELEEEAIAVSDRMTDEELEALLKWAI